MTVDFHAKFLRDVKKIKEPHVLEAIEKAVLNAEAAPNVTAVRGIKKLKGEPNAYRIKIGDYRIGLWKVGSLLEFSRVAHRKDIYKMFP